MNRLYEYFMASSSTMRIIVQPFSFYSFALLLFYTNKLGKNEHEPSILSSAERVTKKYASLMTRITYNGLFAVKMDEGWLARAIAVGDCMTNYQ